MMILKVPKKKKMELISTSGMPSEARTDFGVRIYVTEKFPYPYHVSFSAGLTYAQEEEGKAIDKRNIIQSFACTGG